jgi:hypothetical protein
LILGESESVIKCLQAKENGQNFAKSAYFQRLINNDSATITIGKDIETAQKIVKVLGDTKEENKDSASFYLTETRFDGNGIERKTFSDFGMIGMIIEQFDEE